MFQNNTMYKIYFYNLSLVPLYLTFFIQKISISEFLPFTKEHYLNLLIANRIAFLLMGLVLISMMTILLINREMQYGFKAPKRYLKVKSADFEHLTFISTYIIPLMAFKLDTTRDLAVLAFTIIFMGIIYIKANLYYLNPILLLFGYKIFKSEKEDGVECILLTREDNLDIVSELKYIDLGRNIYFVKKPTEG